MQDDEVPEFAEAREESRPGGEVDVGFVEDDHAVEFAEQPFDAGRREGVARGVVRGAEPQQTGALVGGRQQGVGRKREVRAERDLAHLDVVDVGGDAVHAVGRGDRNGVVDARTAEDAVAEVDGLVAAVADEDLFFAHAFQRGDLLFEELLMRVGVAVDTVVVGVFVGVEPRRDLSAGKLVAGRGVGFQRPDVGAHQFFERSHSTPPFMRTRTAAACAPRPSASAMAMTVGERAASPLRESS